MPTSRLLFVDTNIWLDFYRSRTEAGLSLLKHLEVIKDQLIISYQLEIEFKKNRQNVILESFNALKAPSDIPNPRMFSDAKTAKALAKDLKNAEKRVKALKKRLQRVLDDPTHGDQVYQICQRCCHNKREEAHRFSRGSRVKLVFGLVFVCSSEHTIRRSK